MICKYLINVISLFGFDSIFLGHYVCVNKPHECRCITFTDICLQFSNIPKLKHYISSLLAILYIISSDNKLANHVYDRPTYWSSLMLYPTQCLQFCFRYVFLKTIRLPLATPLNNVWNNSHEINNYLIQEMTTCGTCLFLLVSI